MVAGGGAGARARGETGPALAVGRAGTAELRRHNRALVLRHIRAHGPCSRATVAAATGLAKAAVTGIVGELVEAGLLTETGTAPAAGRGRPGTLLRLADETAAALGVEVNVDYTAVVAVDLSGRPVFSEVLPPAGPAPARPYGVSPGGAAGRVRPGAVADLVRELAGRLRDEGRRLLGVALGVPGLVDTESGVVRDAPNLGWRDVPAARLVAGALGDGDVPVLVDNDANLAVLAEAAGGAARGARSAVYVTGTVGVGAGILMEGRIVRGVRGYAGEVGHMPIAGAEARCGCGRTGCWEAVVGLDSLMRRAAPDLPAPALPYRAKIEALVERARAGDGRVLAALDHHGRRLGRGAAVLVNLLNPEVLVLGGDFTDLAPWCLPPLRAELAAHVLAPALGGCAVRPSTLGPLAAAQGGAARQVDRAFAALHTAF
ncbi:ROK family protein [Bailinhaonella thermotolerans]|uniref:ROK family protein n=1 Tax=Bailinhaonella thermotolerans TaxID=1070861 RepID=A0A3A4B6D3_9ACTN|nr:ROK family protein [Bailinhaonella thermotolerans]RJL36190.1 ROK family protein [Bailinhaonella thermotolerans]